MALSDEQRKKLWEDAMMNPYLASNAFPYKYAYSGPMNGDYRGSPTDLNDHRYYPYMEPERDEQGTYYGYKILYKKDTHCSCPDCTAFHSPKFPVQWLDGELEADQEPSESTMFGIHFTKHPSHPELRQWMYVRGYYNEKSFLVKCALSGTVIETEQGFRSQHATIIGVYQNGYWQSYQDYQERSQANYRKYTFRPEEGYWLTGDWNLDPRNNPDP